MDRRLARKNLRTGMLVAGVALFMFAMSFVAAFVYTHA